MKRSALLVVVVAVFFLVALGFREERGNSGCFIPKVNDSALLVKNKIHKIRSVSLTPVYRRHERGEVLYFNVGDSIVPTLPDTDRVVTWKEYDHRGRVVSIVDTVSATDKATVWITEQLFTYIGNALVEHSLREHYEPTFDSTKNNLKRIEITRWNKDFTWRHTETEDAGQWNIQVDSTVYNRDGQKRIRYTYNSMRDSFVEEFTYDAKSRLKYRRLTMKQFWSPPWELESSTYSYSDDGGKVAIDSAWRNDPDMDAARKRAGDRKASDYKWRVIAAAPSTGKFNRLETCQKFTYNVLDSLVHRETWEQYAYMWEDYTWVYDKDNKLILRTEYRGDKPGDHSVYGDACTDSIWYEYKNGILYHEKVRRFCNTYHTDYDDTFHMAGVHLDPYRTTRVKYTGNIVNGAEEITVYKRGWYDSRKVVDGQGLLLQMSTWSFYRDETVTTYEYFTW